MTQVKKLIGGYIIVMILSIVLIIFGVTQYTTSLEENNSSDGQEIGHFIGDIQKGILKTTKEVQ